MARPYDENPSEEPYIDLIRREEVHAKQFEMRLAIDELMRLELERLKDAEWREKNKRKWLCRPCAAPPFLRAYKQPLLARTGTVFSISRMLLTFLRTKKEA